MTDKRTLDLYFAQREHFVYHAKMAAQGLQLVNDMAEQNDLNIHPLAGDYIIGVLADPKIYGRRTPFRTYEEIKERVTEEEPRFTEDDIKHGLDNLLSETPPRIEKRTPMHTIGRHVVLGITTYSLREQND